MNRWVDHYSELSLRETVDTQLILPFMDELDAEPIIEELGETIDAFSSGKAPPSYGIPPKVM